MLKNLDGSSYHYGIPLAMMFFFTLTLESVTQRQLCFAARRIGLRVRAALIALIYKKSISISLKSGCPSNGKFNQRGRRSNRGVLLIHSRSLAYSASSVYGAVGSSSSLK
ncbi:hypothetical protein ACFX13_011940 [Malus domestica]